MEEGIPPCGELFAVYELETGVCLSATGSHLGDILGGAIFRGSR